MLLQIVWHIYERGSPEYYSSLSLNTCDCVAMSACVIIYIYLPYYKY